MTSNRSPSTADPAGRARLRIAARSLAAAWLLPALLALLAGAALQARALDATAMARAASALGGRAMEALEPLQAMLAGLPGLDDPQRLQQVNRFFNERVRHRPDLEVWGQVDHWASPLQMLARAEGDCEDYAIAKYLALVAGGMPAARLRLVYVRARTGDPGEPAAGQPHMVLAYYARPDAEPLVLDNLLPAIEPASARRDLTPVFSFNGEGLWQGTGAARAGDPLARLTRWRAVLEQARLEGFR